MHRIVGIGAMGATTCCCLLELFLTKKIELTEWEFDQLCEKLITLLGDSRDETYRLVKED